VRRNHLPRQCGIATFTADLCDAISADYGTAQLSGVAVNDGHSPYSYPERVRFEITEGNVASYGAAATFLNAGNVDLVCLQHVYGIFGGKSGTYILELLNHLKMPVITTLHTVLREPNLDQRVVMHKIAARSQRLVMMILSQANGYLRISCNGVRIPPSAPYYNARLLGF